MIEVKAWLDNAEIVTVLKQLSNEVERLNKKVQELQEFRYKMDNQVD